MRVLQIIFEQNLAYVTVTGHVSTSAGDNSEQRQVCVLCAVSIAVELSREWGGKRAV